jgi:hypothetical protein
MCSGCRSVLRASAVPRCGTCFQQDNTQKLRNSRPKCQKMGTVDTNSMFVFDAGAIPNCRIPLGRTLLGERPRKGNCVASGSGRLGAANTDAAEWGSRGAYTGHSPVVRPRRRDLRYRGRQVAGEPRSHRKKPASRESLIRTLSIVRSRPPMCALERDRPGSGAHRDVVSRERDVGGTRAERCLPARTTAVARRWRSSVPRPERILIKDLLHSLF